MSEKLKAMGLTNLQIVTILSVWSTQGIVALLRGEIEPQSHESIIAAVLACGALD